MAGLGSRAYREREESERALVRFKELAIPAVRRASRGSDPEVARRAEAILRRLSDQLPPEKLEVKDYDLIETEFPIRGRIEPDSLKVKSRYSGDSESRFAEVRSLRSTTTPAVPPAIMLDAASYARQGWSNWMDTGIDVSANEPLEISASRTIDQWPQQPGQHMSGPAGTGNPAPGLPNGIAVVFPPQAPGAPVPNRGFTPSGALIGRVGPGGTPLLIGATYKQPRAPGTGRLMLIVAPSNWGNECAGTYQVKVSAGNN